MSGYKLLIFAVAIAVLPALASGQYWFQSGVVGSQSTAYNNGASISIQNNYNQNISVGSFGYWVGERLSNNAFLQIGYYIENRSGFYSTNCTVSGCNGSIYMEAGQPAWFWEYFPKNDSNNTFYGAAGTTGIGLNGTFNNYSFVSSGSLWTFYMNGVSLGSVDLGTGDSGVNFPYAAAEYADASTNTTYMIPVSFRNFKIYKNGRWVSVPVGQSAVGYGSGSDTALKNSYGVKEAGNKVNYFMVGSGIPVPRNGTVLWSSGYNLTINSAYGNSGTINYTGLSSVQISEPSLINVSSSERILFDGWIGTGAGSYTGNASSAYVSMYDNIVERAVWTVQYKITAGSEFGNVSGGGWYDYGSIANVSVDRNVSYESSTERYALASWNDNMTGRIVHFVVTGPENLTALWEREYLVNASTKYGSVNGNGWYPYMSNATLSLNFSPIMTGDGSRIGFYSWSNGIRSRNYSITVDNSVSLSTIFKTQYSENISVKNVEGNGVSFSYVMMDGTKVYNSTEWMFSGMNKVTSVGFAGYNIGVNNTFNVSGVGSVSIQVPLYNVRIHTTDVLGIPLNASVLVTFMNGTSHQFYSGNGGVVSLSNLVDGYVNGTVSYKGSTKQFSSVNDVSVAVRFMSVRVLVIFFVVSVAIVALAFIVVKKYHNRKVAD